MLMAFYYVAYYCIQLPMWRLSYNSHGNVFDCKGKITKCSIKLNGGGNKVVIGKDVRLHNVKISLVGNGLALYIGEGTIWMESGRIRLENDNNYIKIGKNCDFRGCFFTCSESGTGIEIGDDCLFSANVVIRASDSHSILDAENMRINHGKDVHIGKHVWLCNGVAVLKGCDIGDDSVLGTNCVISSKQIPSGSVVAGNPGQIVKQNITWSKSLI